MRNIIVTLEKTVFCVDQWDAAVLSVDWEGPFCACNDKILLNETDLASLVQSKNEVRLRDCKNNIVQNDHL